MSAPYDLTQYTARDDGGWLRVWCRVTWTPRGGHPVTITGHHLDIKDGAAVLMCGMYEAAEKLGIEEPEDDYALAISALVDKQLVVSPRAELWCPDGLLVIELVEPPRT